MQVILDKIEIIDFKYRKQRELNDFNIFSVLRGKTDEVKLHSRFIAELLNPKGMHRQGSLFLNHFLMVCEFDPVLYQDSEIFTEYRDIDILIRSGKSAIVIENKIWAGDQERQLERYRNIMLEEGIEDIQLIYLTLEGREPSLYSLGDLQNDSSLKTYLRLLAYRNEILQWLDLCIREVPVAPALRESIAQYKNLINELTGNTMVRDQMLEVVNLLSQNDNILQAKKIVDNWVHVKWHTEWEFWTELEKTISQEYRILPHQKYSVEYLNGSIHRSKNRDNLYGILFSIKRLGNDELCIAVEKGGDERMYYGITILRDGTDRGASDEPIYNDLANKVGTVSEWDREANWIGGKYFKEPVNFVAFNNESTLKLLNAEYRSKAIDSLWKEIKDYIHVCKLDIYEF
jgi:hypothetical protein